MPSLPTSSPSVPSFSLSPSGIAAVVLFVVLVLGGCGVYFVAVPFLRRKLEERRVKVADSEKVSNASIISYPAPKAQKAAAATALAQARARLPVTLKRSVTVVPSARKSAGIAVPGPQLTRLVACNADFSARFGSSRIRSSPGPSPLRAVVLAPEPVCAEVPVFNPKQVAAAGYLVAARILLAIKAKDAVISKAPFVATQKSPRERLRQSPNSEVPARFGISRNSPRREPSPLRTVNTASEPEPEPAPAVAKAASQHVEEPAIAHALAGLFASTYQDAEDGDPSHFFDSSYDEEHLFIDLDLSRAVPAPVPVSVTAPPSGIPIIIVESPSLVLGDRRLDGRSSRSRQRSNSFKDSLAVRKRAPSSIAQQHGGSKGKKGDSRLLQVPKLLNSQDKENENGRQWVPSRPHPARTSP